MTKDEVEEFFRRLSGAIPAPRTELEYENPFTLLVAVVLSAQATDVGVNKATPALFAAADTPRKMLALGETRLRDYIRTIGLFNTKAKNIVKLSQALIERFGGEVPRERGLLESLPGVGRKTANVVLNEAFGVPAIAVDTHVLRVSNRLGWAQTQDPSKVELELLEITPKRWWGRVTLLLIHHGRRCCAARKPRCGACPVLADCPYGRREAGSS